MQEDSRDLQKRLAELEQENKLLRLDINRHNHFRNIYKYLRILNRMAVLEKDPKIFIFKACEYLLEYHGYQKALIILLDSEGGIKTAAGAGFGERSETIFNSLKNEMPSGCWQLALKNKEAVIVKDQDNECEYCSLCDLSEEQGAMTIRLKYGNTVYGVLTVSLSAEYLKDSEELLMFEELADDLGLALNYLSEDEKARRFNYIIQTLPQTFSFLSTDYRYLAVNDIYSYLFDIPTESFIGHYVSEFFSEDMYESEIKPMFDLCLDGIPQDYVLKIDFKNLGRRWMHMYYFPYRDSDGSINGIISHGIDVTEQKKAENDQRLSENRYKHLVETTSDTISIISEEGIIITINDSACRKLGIRNSEIIGKTITSLDYTYSVKRFKDFWGQVPLNEPVIFESEYCKKDGTKFPVEINGRKVKINNEIRIISFARDITERNRDREQLLAAVKSAEESERLKSAFLANMSHEIRTPLNGILGFSSLMNDPDITEEKQKQYFSLIEECGNRLLTTINDIIDLSRIETGIIENDISVVDVEKLIDELYRFFKPELDKKGIDFILEKKLQAPGFAINTDRGKLYAVLMNILKNAVKFTAAGSIWLGYTRNGDITEFYIKDTGIGIPSDKLESIFDRFIQVDQTMTKPYEGSGLGLSISREYIKILGGKIWAESEYGKGSSFFLTIPDYKE